jgi:hypothetical protein
MPTKTALAFLFAALSVAGRRPADQQLFASYSVLELTLKAPLGDLFAQDEDEANVSGILSYRDETGRDVTIEHVAISERGNTSKQENECRFPKLKLRLEASDARERSIFRDSDVVKIGTHCGDSPDGTLSRKYGRLPNEHATHREAFIYRLLDTFGMPSLRARPARITYEDTSREAAIGSITRDAMLLEDEQAAMKRIGASKSIAMERFHSAKEELSPADTINVAFAEALIGNFDWCLKMAPGDKYRCDARKPLWNVLALAKSSDGVVPVIYDFDIAGMVTGRHPWFPTIFNAAFVQPPSEPRVEVDAQLQRTRSVFTRGELDAERTRFAGQKEPAYRALESAAVDDRGKRQIKGYLDAFFAAMERDDRFYLPVVLRDDTRAYTDAAATDEACVKGPLPIGTPVSEPLARNGPMMRVVVLDALWHFTGQSKCPAILKGPVWIDGKSIGSDYPAATR